MKKKMIAAATAAVLLSPAALAESDLYVSGGYSAFDGDGATISALTARGGYFFSQNVGVELEGSFGISEEEVDGFPGVDLELNNQFAGYVVGRLPMAENFDLLGRIGYTTGELEASGGGASLDADIDGVAFGVGGQYFFTETVGVRGDYTRIEVDDSDIDGGIDVFTVSAVFKFGAPQ